MIPQYRGTRVLVGPPGVGKTRYLADRIPRIVGLSERVHDPASCPVLICSLTNAAAREIGSRVSVLPDEATRTLHSHCYRAGARGPVVDHDLVREEWNQLHPALAITPPKRRKGVPDDIATGRRGEMPGDEVAQQYDMLRHRLVPLDKMPPRVQAFGRLWGAWKTDIGAIDFIDMLEFAPAHPPLDPDVIVVDESQDLSPLGWRVIRCWAESAGGLIAVGDPWQALYDPWAGADAATFLAQYKTADDHAVLRQSWRVPAAVHRRAMRWIRHLSDYEPIEYFPRRENCLDRASPFVEGSVVRCDATWTDPQAAIEEAIELAAQGKRVFFVFTANYMAQELCAEMRRRSLRFDHPWRKDELAWNPLRDPNSTAFEALLDPGKRWTPRGLAEWTAPLVARGLLRRGAKQTLRAREERGVITIEDLRGWFEPEALAELQRVASSGDERVMLEWWSSRLLSRSREAARYAVSIYLKHGRDALHGPALLHPGTAHGAKGAEVDHVFLFPDLSVAAGDAWDDGRRARDPIVRAIYVGMTRCRECLHICEPAGKRYVEL